MNPARGLEIEVIEFDAEDVIVTSLTNPNETEMGA